MCCRAKLRHHRDHGKPGNSPGSAPFHPDQHPLGAHIEALLLARASAPKRRSAGPWKRPHAGLYIQPATVTGAMADLGKSGMLPRDEAHEAWHYERQPSELCDLIDRWPPRTRPGW